jgi:tetratricopeptide (TPR) repeat protein
MTPSAVHRFKQAITEALRRWDLAEAERLASAFQVEAAAAPDSGGMEPPPRFQADFAAGQVALLSGRFSKAVAWLKPLLPLANPEKKTLVARLRLLLAEAYVRGGRLDEGRRLLAEVPVATPETDLGLRLRALRVRLWVETVPSEEVAACATELAKQKDSDNEALLWCETGCARDRAGDLTAAEEYWQRAIQVRISSKVRPAHADSLLHLGRLNHLRGRLSRALDRYERVADCGLPGQLLEARLRRLLVLLELGRWSVARAEADDLLPAGAIDRMPEVLHPLARLVRGLLDDDAEGLAGSARAWVLARTGRPAEARALYAEELAGEDAPERRASICLALGLLEGDRKGEVWLREAERLGRERAMPGVLERSLVARGRSAAACHNEQEARELFEKAVELSEVEADGLWPWVGLRHSVLQHLLEAACRRRDAAAVFTFQERERGRLLLEWLARDPGRRTTKLFERPDWAALSKELTSCEAALKGAAGEARRTLLQVRAELLARRDVLFERYLLEQGRAGTGLLPRLPTVDDLMRCLPSGSVYVAPVMTRDGVYLLCADRDRGLRLVYRSGSPGEVEEAITALRARVDGQISDYERGWPVDRVELDRLLERVGEGPLGQAFADLLADGGVRRLVWAPDAALHGLPMHAVRWSGRYLVERVEVIWTFSASLLVQQQRTRPQQRGIWRPAVAVASAASLPAALAEAEGVSAAFLRGRCPPAGALDRRGVRRWLGRSWLAHFACHAEFDAERPLSACLRLPSGEAIHALEWLEEPVKGLRLVTLSACRSAQVGSVAGGEVFGMVSGLLAGGARAVVAGLWPVADDETPPFMWSFYRHLLLEPLPSALARAQREALARPDGSPLFWAAFALFGDAEAVRPASRPWRWLARWRQRRHARRCANIALRTI